MEKHSPRPEPKFSWFVPIDGDGFRAGTRRAERPPTFDYLRQVVTQAKQDGFTSTLYGRRRYLPDLLSDNRQLRQMAERAALNAPIQGSAADIIKRAMIDVDAGLNVAGLKSRLLLQVHDELVLEVAPGEREQVEQLLVEKMGAAAELTVPLDVHVGLGDSWHAAAH